MKKLHIYLILLGALALASCSKPNPSPKDVETQIKLALPPWLDVSVAKQEVLEPRENEMTISYEAQIAPKEDLYVLDNEAMSNAQIELGGLLLPDEAWKYSSTPEITREVVVLQASVNTPQGKMIAEELAKIHLIKVAVPAGQQTRIYGKIGATRTGKTFQFSTPQIETQSPVFTAKPKSSFPDTLVTGSPEHKAAMEQITNKIKTHQAEVRQQKEKRLQEIRSAFAAGKSYTGTWTDAGVGNTGQIAMAIDESDGKTFKAHLYDPEKPEQKKPAQGNIVYDSETHQAKLVGINGQGNPPVDLRPDGLNPLAAFRATCATTYYRFLETNSTVDFELKIQPDGTLKGDGMLSAGSGRGGHSRGTISLQPKDN